MKAVEYGKDNKEVIIFLHGGGLSWWNYKEVAERLVDHFHIVIPILNGHSGSDLSFTSIENNAKEIIAYIDENFEGHVLLIGGLSLGGQILVEMLSQRSSICEFAIIENADTVNISENDMVAFLMANSNYSVKDTLSDCKSKVLVLVGSKENSIMKKSARIIADHLLTSRLEVMENYYHGDFSINHSEQYVEKLLQLISN